MFCAFMKSIGDRSAAVNDLRIALPRWRESAGFSGEGSTLPTRLAKSHTPHDKSPKKRSHPTPKHQKPVNGPRKPQTDICQIPVSNAP